MSTRTVWRMITHHGDPERLLAWMRDSNQVALGWNRIGEASKYDSPKEITQAIQRAYPGLANSGPGGVQLWNFLHVVELGDLVILSTGARRAMVMEVTGPYRFAEEHHEDDRLYTHRRDARPVAIDADRLWRSAGGSTLAPGNNIRWAFVRCSGKVSPEA
jgi:predicted Mrr-cat superfamily restriction endonuclease